MAAGDVEVNLTTPIAKRGALFDGVDDILIISDNATVHDIWDGGASLALWIFPLSTGGAGQGRMLEKRHLFYITQEAGGNCNLKLETTWSGNKGIWTTTGRPVTMNAWNRIMLTYNSDNTVNDPIMYVNGTVAPITEDTAPTGTRSSDAGSDWNIGNNPAKSRDFDGTIGDYTVWSRILSVSEVSQDAGNTKITSNLLLHLPLIDDYTDSVGSNNGTNDGSRLGIFENAVAVAISDARTTANDQYIIATGKGGQIISTIIEE